MLCLSLLIGPLASAEYEEISYEQLLDRLSKKKAAVQSSHYDPFESIKIHAGVGLITSAQQIQINDGTGYRYQNGFEFNLGIDLFSPQWTSEVNLRNFGTTETDTESRNIREYALKLMYKNSLAENMGYRLGGGLGTRLLRFTNQTKEVSLQESTSVYILAGGVDFYINPVLSLGIEAGTRQALVGNSSDKSSADISLRLDTRF